MTTNAKWLTAERAQGLNVLGDCALLAAASVASTITDRSPGINSVVAAGLAFGTILIWTVAGRVLRHYDVENGRRSRGDFALTVLLCCVGLAGLAAARAFVPAAHRASETWRFALVLVPGVLWLRLMTSWLRLGRDKAPRKILIVGTGPVGRHTGVDLRDSAERAEIVGFLRFQNETPHARLPGQVLGTVDDLATCIRERELDEVYLAGNIGAQHADMQRAIRECERYGIPFALPGNVFRFDRATPIGAPTTKDGYVHYQSVRHKLFQWAVKRAFDIFASGLALALLSPLLIGVGIVIKATSRGPIFFKQVRVGLHGRTFHMLKFRSMVVDAEALKAKLETKNEQTGPVFKLQNDPRITPIGRFIRKYSIDELPQLLNVLRGDMTVVGPRPAIPKEVAQYEAWQRRRLSVRPGLTCVWQVSGRNEIGFEEWMYLDMQYIDHWSLAQDFNLILKTVPVVLTGRGAS